MLTVGLNQFGNDTSLAVVDDDGQILLLAEEERWSGVKGGRRWAPPAWILEVLEEFGVPLGEVKSVAAARIQGLHAARPAGSTRPPAPLGVEGVHHGPRQGAAYWSEARLLSHEWLSRQFPRLDAVHEVRHHLCHAATAYLLGPYEQAAVLTADGMGETETATISAGHRGRLDTLWVRHLPHSIGLAYEAVASWVGLTGVEKEGKLMGLAPLGRPRHRDWLLTHFLHPDTEHGFRVTSAVAALPPTAAAWTAYLTDQFGPPGPGGNDVRDIDADLAASIQSIVEDCLRELVALAVRRTGATACVAAGGVFLNAVANGVLRRDGFIADLWVPPVAGDTGTSLGAALIAANAPHRPLTNCFLGTALHSVGPSLAAARLRAVVLSPEDLAARVADLVLDGAIVGWAQGRAEVGPRALGHRSILADPRRPHVRQRLNALVKERELWRPFAPVVLEEDTPALFGAALRVPYMNVVEPGGQREAIGAALHSDGSARLQTVPEGQTELGGLRLLLAEVKRRTGLGVLLNTSLNGRGQPIARTAAEAIDVFVSCGLDALVLDDHLVLRRDNAGADQRRPPTRPTPPVAATAEPPAACWVVSPWGLPTAPVDVAAALDRVGRTGVAVTVVDRELRPVLAAAAVARATVVVLVPIWAEVAGAAGLLDGFGVGLDKWPEVLLLDEDGRCCVWSPGRFGAGSEGRHRGPIAEAWPPVSIGGAALSSGDNR